MEFPAGLDPDDMHGLCEIFRDAFGLVRKRENVDGHAHRRRALGAVRHKFLNRNGETVKKQDRAASRSGWFSA
jgi:hypothetical protein